MFNILIADDEKIIRDGISKLIDWEKFNCHLVGVEKNGLDVLNRIKDSNKPYPDIIIIDIKMPIMTGLELIQAANTLDKKIVFIVLSGYNEFEYAKSAMSYGVKYYLLKPTSEEDILKTLVSATEDVIKFRRTQEVSNLIHVKLLPDKTYSTSIEEIFHAIDEHIGNQNLTLKWIAENILYMNEDYLSKLFKKEVGQNFSDYLLNKKINLAKEMLLSGSEQKIYEIFETLGFDINTRYFSQVFKKYTGITPSEYRKKNNFTV